MRLPLDIEVSLASSLLLISSEANTSSSEFEDFTKMEGIDLWFCIGDVCSLAAPRRDAGTCGGAKASEKDSRQLLTMNSAATATTEPLQNELCRLLFSAILKLDIVVQALSRLYDSKRRFE